MLKLYKGNIFGREVDCIVNPVNTVGVMGKGLALEAKKRYPDNYAAYKKACDSGSFHVGTTLPYHRGFFHEPKYIINFPTKEDWREPSKIEYIESGLADLVMQIKELELESIAVPALGCGNGGLDWDKVKSLMVYALLEPELSHVDIRLFVPL